MKTILAILAATALVITVAGRVHANEGTGTAGFCERHGCGTPEDPGNVLECPDVSCGDFTVTVECPACPDVTCPALPEVVFPAYYPCRQKKDGTFACPRKKTPHRIFLPETDPRSGK